MCNVDKILILTPVKNAETFLDMHFSNLDKLTYPHHHISLGFLESDSSDQTYALLKGRLPELRKTFRKADAWKKDYGFYLPDGTPRWAGKIQLERRTVLAKSRNALLELALDDEDWVLWMDADLLEYPRNIIEKLLATGKDIVQPHCVLEYGGPTFDCNGWLHRGKKHLDDLRDEGDLVELHAVGGTMLLIKADIHREGLIFPPYLYGKTNPRSRRLQFFLGNWKDWLFGLPQITKSIMRDEFRGEIETEGLGIMADELGYTCWGMPNLEIKHRHE